MFKLIPGFSNICVNECGEILNAKTNNILKPTKAKNGYLYVKVSDDGEIKRIALHRAVGMLFCKGYKKGLVVDHIDGGKTNNHYKNLRWVTQKENITYGYERRGDSSFRNFRVTDLYYRNKYVNSFWSKKEAVKYAVEHFDCKFSMLMKHNEHKDCKVVESVTTIP